MWVLKSSDENGGLLLAEEFTGTNRDEERYRSAGNWFETCKEAVDFAKDYNKALYARGDEITKNDEYYYYITNTQHPDGGFWPSKARKGSTWPFQERSMKLRGNYFETFEEAREVARKFETLTYPRGTLPKDCEEYKSVVGD